MLDTSNPGGVLTEEQAETVRAALVDIYTALPVDGTTNEGQTDTPGPTWTRSTSFCMG